MVSEVTMQRLADIAPAEVRTIWGLLSAIPDPEVPVLTITDLGMVRSVARVASRFPRPSGTSLAPEPRLT